MTATEKAVIDKATLTRESRQRQETRHASRRKEILEAAAAEFAETGYERATLDRIGSRVGLTKASLYYYVDGKEQLLEQLLAQVVADIEQRAAGLAGPDASPVARLHAFATAHLITGTTRPAGKILAENLTVLTASPAAAELMHRHETSVATVLQDGIASGCFRPVPVGPMVKLLFGALNAVPRWFDPEGPLPLNDLTGIAVDTFLSGITSDME
jgi:AcrR family transcriptional regulator